MKRNKRFCLLLIVLLLGLVPTGASEVNVYAAEEEIQLPTLIQTTTLESDYKAITGLGLAFTPLTSKEDLQQAYENILCSCVRIQVEGHYGSGSIYKMLENEIIIVTNRHVLQYWNEDSYVTFFNGAAMGGVLLGISEEADVGFISVPAAGFTYGELLGYRNVRAAVEPVSDEEDDTYIDTFSVGSKIFFVNMASDWKSPDRIDGEIISPLIYLEDFQTEMLYGTGEAVPGMSGCGVFDGYGHYLGMVTGGTLQGEIAAVPAKTINGEYLRVAH